MNIDIRLLPGLFEESFCQISAADAVSSQEEIVILLLVVAVGPLERYDEITSLVYGSKQ